MRKSRKFLPISSFEEVRATPYYLLPFHFIKISNSKEVLVNFVGDFLIVEKGTAQKIVSRQIDKDSILYADLFSNFFISDKVVPDLVDILATRYRTKKSFLEGFTKLHIFVLTLRCNHTCKYCQVSRVTENKTEFDISIPHLKKSIELMLLSPSRDITMEFQGGDPLLSFEKVVFSVEYTKSYIEEKKLQKNINFVICTNSTIISDDILEFCKKHHILISTSLDGPEFIHNKNRYFSKSGSYKSVIDGIKKFRETLGHDRVSALMTTSTLSLDYPKQIINTYIENGFNNIFLRPISPYGFAIKSRNKYQSDKFLSFYKEALDYILDLNLNGFLFIEDYTLLILKKILTPFPTNYVDLQSPAGLINSVVVYNYDGYIYASDESRMLAENKDYTFRLGHVQDSYDDIFRGERALKIADYWSNEALAGCSDCAFQSYCGADPVFNYATQGDLYGFRPNSEFCKKNMGIIKHLFNLIDTHPEVFEIFQSWIKKVK